MQTLTILFAFAIVAIAIENFTAEFLRVENSDADAKDLPEIISRAEAGFEIGLRGTTGKEKVIIRDGDEKTEITLDKKQYVTVKNPKIVIEYTNDECCKPDRNVMFISTLHAVEISTANNTFPQNYETKWNCSSCPDKSKPNTKKQMDLSSRMDPLDEMIDRCEDVRNTPDDFCDNCKILKEGQFCGPGNYTIEFKTEGACKDVTFGGCRPPEGEILHTEVDVLTPQQCNQNCKLTTFCQYYRFDNQTRNCDLMRLQNRALHCNIWAGPADKTGTQCLYTDNKQWCDTLVQEDCEYNGELLRDYLEGQIAAADTCQELCKGDPRCKYWIYNFEKLLCILKRENTKTCTVWGGPKDPTFDFCQKHSPNY